MKCIHAWKHTTSINARRRRMSGVWPAYVPYSTVQFCNALLLAVKKHSVFQLILLRHRIWHASMPAWHGCFTPACRTDWPAAGVLSNQSSIAYRYFDGKASGMFASVTVQVLVLVRLSNSSYCTAWSIIFHVVTFLGRIPKGKKKN